MSRFSALTSEPSQRHQAFLPTQPSVPNKYSPWKFRSNDFFFGAQVPKNLNAQSEEFDPFSAPIVGATAIPHFIRFHLTAACPALRCDYNPTTCLLNWYDGRPGQDTRGWRLFGEELVSDWRICDQTCFANVFPPFENVFLYIFILIFSHLFRKYISPIFMNTPFFAKNWLPWSVVMSILKNFDLDSQLGDAERNTSNLSYILESHN